MYLLSVVEEKDFMHLLFPSTPSLPIFASYIIIVGSPGIITLISVLSTHFNGSYLASLLCLNGLKAYW